MNWKPVAQVAGVGICLACAAVVILDHPAAVVREVPGPAVTRTVRVIQPPKVVIRYRTRPAPTPSPSPAAAPPTPHINGGTWSVTVNCLQEQCTSYPGAGPGQSTCGQIVNNEQVCVGGTGAG